MGIKARGPLRRGLATLSVAAMIVAGCGVADGDDQTAAGENAESTPEASTSALKDGNATTTTASTETTTDETTAGDTPTTESAGEAAVDLSDAATVTVSDQGAEPRVELRIQVEPGQNETMAMTQTQEIRQEIDGVAQPGAGPIPMIMEMELTAGSKGGSLLTYESILVSVEVGEGVDPAFKPQLELALAPMVGVTTTAILDDRGRPLSTEISGTEGLDPTVADTVEQLTTSSQFAHPLPEEPVGVGATWEVDQLLEVSGLDVMQTTTYEVLSIDGTVVELGLATVQTVEVGSEMVAQGVTATVQGWETIGSGSIRWDLAKMVPTSTSQVLAIQELGFGAAANNATLEQTLETLVEVSPG